VKGASWGGSKNGSSRGKAPTKRNDERREGVPNKRLEGAIVQRGLDIPKKTTQKKRAYRDCRKKTLVNPRGKIILLIGKDDAAECD